MKKKVLAMISVAVTASMLITGCGSSSSSDAADSSADDAATEETAEEEAADDTEEASDDAEAADDTEEASAASDDAFDLTGIDASTVGKIGMVVNYAGQDPYQTAYYDAMTAYADEIGADLQILDPKGDATKQANQVQDLINMDCSVIILWPVNGESAVASARAIDKAGIKCITANTDVAETGAQFTQCYVGPSNVEEGKNTALQMVEDLGGSGKIAEITGPAGYTTSLERTQGMEEGIEGSDIEILDSQTGEGNREKCQQVAENYLIKYGVGEIDAIYCFDDNGAIGAVNAVEAAGRDDVKVYAAASGSYSTLDYIINGQIAATSMQSPYYDAESALAMAVKIANGETPAEHEYYIETPIATPDNAEQLKSELEEW